MQDKGGDRVTYREEDIVLERVVGARRRGSLG